MYTLLRMNNITEKVKQLSCRKNELRQCVWSKLSAILQCGDASLTLREKCLNRDFFLVRIFPYSDWIRRDTPYLCALSPNAGKYGPEKSPYLDTFHTVLICPLHAKLKRNNQLHTISYIQQGLLWNIYSEIEFKLGPCGLIFFFSVFIY